MWAIGVTGGLEKKGIKVSAIFTNGNLLNKLGPSSFLPYPNSFVEQLKFISMNIEKISKESKPINRSKLMKTINKSKDLKEQINATSKEITGWSNHAIEMFIEKFKIKPEVIGFNGQPIFNSTKTENQLSISYELGVPGDVADFFNCTVVHDFTWHDSEKLGNGAENGGFLPIFYKALFFYLNNNECSYGKDNFIIEVNDFSKVISFNQDTNPKSEKVGTGNVLTKEITQRYLQVEDDQTGEIAINGSIEQALVNKCLNDYLKEKADIKQTDYTFARFSRYLDETLGKGLSPLDSLSTLSALSAQMIAKHVQPYKIKSAILTGRLQNNKFLRMILSQYFKVVALNEILPETDFIEAQQYAYYAVRSIIALPNSFPETTGVTMPVSTGKMRIPIKNEKHA